MCVCVCVCVCVSVCVCVCVCGGRVAFFFFFFLHCEGAILWGRGGADGGVCARTILCAFLFIYLLLFFLFFFGGGCHVLYKDVYACILLNCIIVGICAL